MALRPVTAFRWTVLVLLALIVALQVRLWTGTAGMPGVERLEKSIARQRSENVVLLRRNEALAADVADLKSGREAVEERAREELGMTKPGEVFYQVIEPTAPAGAETPDS